jgi:hypothetical protein
MTNVVQFLKYATNTHWLSNLVYVLSHLPCKGEKNQKIAFGINLGS